MGHLPGILVAVGDIVKGYGAVFTARELGLSENMILACGWVAVLAYDFTPFLRFQGGQEMSTSVGVLLLILPQEHGGGHRLRHSSLTFAQLGSEHGSGFCAFPHPRLVVGETQQTRSLHYCPPADHRRKEDPRLAAAGMARHLRNISKYRPRRFCNHLPTEVF